MVQAAARGTEYGPTHAHTLFGLAVPECRLLQRCKHLQVQAVQNRPGTAVHTYIHTGTYSAVRTAAWVR